MAFTTNVEKIWESLGSFWGQFPDKDLFTNLWTNYVNLASELFRRKAQINLSKFLKTLIPVLEYKYESYTPIFSGDNKNTITISGLQTLPIDDFMCSIPNLLGIETEQILTENSEYKILNKNKIQFLTQPEYDPKQTDIENTITLYSNIVYRHNPILWRIHASGIGLNISSLDNEDYLPYNTITSSGIDHIKDIADHYKYFIWGLSEIKRRAPTIETLLTGYGISRGLAFAYRAGTVNNINNNTINILVSGLDSVYDEYIIPSGYNICVEENEFIPQFNLLISGISFHDHVNDYNYITSLAGVNEFNYTSTIVFKYNSNLNNLNYNSTYHNDYIESLIPKNLNYTSSME